MKVYILFNVATELIEGVYSTREKALNRKKLFKSSWWYEIEEWVVN